MFSLDLLVCTQQVPCTMDCALFPLSLRALPAGVEQTHLPVGASCCPAASLLPAATWDALEWAGTSAWVQPLPARRGDGRVLRGSRRQVGLEEGTLD